MVPLWASCGQGFSALPNDALSRELTVLIHPVLEGVSSLSDAPGVREFATCVVKIFSVMLKKLFALLGPMMNSPTEYRGAPLGGENAFPFQKIALSLFTQTVTWVACPW